MLQVSHISVHQLIISQVRFLLSEMQFPPGTIVSYAECNEMFPSPILEMVYTTTVTVIQFLFPLVIAALANTAIYCKLRDRLKTFSSMEANDKRKSDILRMKRFGLNHREIEWIFCSTRTCWLLISMVTIFLICWLPLSIFNLMMGEIRENTDDNTFFTMFASCHLFGEKDCLWTFSKTLNNCLKLSETKTICPIKTFHYILDTNVRVLPSSVQTQMSELSS